MIFGLNIWNIFIGLFMVVIIYSLIEPYLIREKITVIKSKKIKGRLDGIKIVFVSDIHQGKLMSVGRVKDIVKRINKLEPDIVLLGGDYITFGTDIEKCFAELNQIKSRYGTYGVLGNHEHKTGLAQAVSEKMKECNIIQMDNKAEWICIENEKIRIGGVGDLLYDTQNINPLLENSEKAYSILLSHNPDYVDEIKKNGYEKEIDLMLSGDTHGGQVTFFGLWTPFLRTESARTHRSGEFDIGNMKLIVSNGIGVLGVPLRLWARPEINVIILGKDAE